MATNDETAPRKSNLVESITLLITALTLAFSVYAFFRRPPRDEFILAQKTAIYRQLIQEAVVMRRPGVAESDAAKARFESLHLGEFRLYASPASERLAQEYVDRWRDIRKVAIGPNDFNGDKLDESLKSLSTQLKREIGTLEAEANPRN